MFRKPIKIKNHTQLKASERKIFKEKLLQGFPNLHESDFEDIFTKKDVMSSIKIVTSSDDIIQVYSLQKRPIAFEVRGRVFPTVFLLWKFPNLIPSFTSHSEVISFLNSGADFMVPGVITPPGSAKYGNVSEGAIACINTNTNKAAIAIGITAQSSMEMLSGRGKCLIIYHLFGDKLCSLEGVNSGPIIDLGPPDWLKLTNYNEDFPALGAPKSVESAIEHLDIHEDVTPEQEVCSVQDMDDLLNYCFFVVAKYSKNLTLPILTSNFYKLQMMNVCPENKTLDIKKSSYKKLKPFLDTLSKENLIIVKEVKKGVESITAINKEHPKFTEFYIEPSLRPRKEDESPPSTSVIESFIITPNVLPLFIEGGFNKGDTIQMVQIRKFVTEYVKKFECQNPENQRLVKPKEALVKICRTENYITWEELMEKVCDAMKSCFKVKTGNDEVVNKGKITPIVLTISQRSGNKKVTLIDNLELFGINLTEFAKECQHGVAASTSINKVNGKKCDQLLVQGNQILFIQKLLTEKYKIPVKYMRGLEHAVKKK